LRYGIDRQRFEHATGDAVRERFGIPADADVVLYVGRLVRDMGLHVLLEGLASLLARRADAHVLMVGGAGELEAEARAVAAGSAGPATAVVQAAAQWTASHS